MGIFYIIINTCIIMLENFLQNKRNKFSNWASIPISLTMECYLLSGSQASILQGTHFAMFRKKAKKVQNRNKMVTFNLHNHTYKWLYEIYTDSYSLQERF